MGRELVPSTRSLVRLQPRIEAEASKGQATAQQHPHAEDLVLPQVDGAQHYHPNHLDHSDHGGHDGRCRKDHLVVQNVVGDCIDGPHEHEQQHAVPILQEVLAQAGGFLPEKEGDQHAH